MRTSRQTFSVAGALVVPFSASSGADHAPALEVTVIVLEVPLSSSTGVDFAPGLVPGSIAILIPFSDSAGAAFAPSVFTPGATPAVPSPPAN